MNEQPSSQYIVKSCFSDFCGFTQPVPAVTPAQHLLIWLTPERRQLVNAIGFDKALNLGFSRLSRYLSGARHMKLERAGVEAYYPLLRLLGYSPGLNLDADESVQRDLAGLEPFSYTREANQSEITSAPYLVSPARHLLTWLTPERRQLINARGFDRALNLKFVRFSRYLKGEKYIKLERAGVESYYPLLRLLGYSPGLNLDADESVQRHRAGLEPFSHIKKVNELVLTSIKRTR